VTTTAPEGASVPPLTDEVVRRIDAFFDKQHADRLRAHRADRAAEVPRPLPDWAIIGAAMQLALHAVAKITLFFGAGAIQVAHNRKTIPELDGLGRVMPWTFGAFTVGCLSIIGLPLFAGMWSKWYLVLASLQAEQLILVGALLLSSLLNILYMLTIPIRGFFAPAAQGVPTEGIHEAPLAQRVAMMICASGCVVLFFWPDPLFQLVGMLVVP